MKRMGSQKDRKRIANELKKDEYQRFFPIEESFIPSFFYQFPFLLRPFFFLFFLGFQLQLEKGSGYKGKSRKLFLSS